MAIHTESERAGLTSAAYEQLAGVGKSLLPKIETLPTVEVRTPFARIHNITAIAFVGASGAGKSTLVDRVRLASDEVTVPMRYITRPKREGDNILENRHVTREEFDAGVHKGEIGIHWERPMEGERVERYGFESIPQKKLAILSANNAFCRSYQGEDSDTILKVAVYAPTAIREARLGIRSPDLSSDETRYRVGDAAEDILKECDIVIHNYGEGEASALDDVVTLVNGVMEERLPWGEIRDLGNHREEYGSRLFSIVNHDVLFSDGKMKSFQYVERPPGVRTLIRSGDKLLLNREWREEHGAWDYRLPGGKVFESQAAYSAFQRSEKSEPLEQLALDAARREVEEETGVTLSSEGLQFAHCSPCGSVINWDLYYFVASVGAEKAAEAAAVLSTEESERLVPVWVTQEEAINLCLMGQVREERSAMFLMRQLKEKVIVRSQA